MTTAHGPDKPVERKPDPAETARLRTNHELLALTWVVALLVSIVFAIATAGIGLFVVGIVLVAGLIGFVVAPTRKRP
jgi:Flp pilus assembly protein TadB